MGQVVDSQVKGRSMLPLWILLIIFALPAIAAWFFYLNPEMLPQGRSNRGELIEQPLSVAEISLKTPQGATLDLATLQPKWALVLVSSGDCDNVCQQKVLELRQIGKALAENSSRLKKLLIIFNPGSTESIEKLMTNFPDTHVALGNSVLHERLSRAISGERKIFNTAWIIDPMGRLMMHYKVKSAAEDMLKDLEKLMKASKSWVKGAQYGHQ